MLQNVIANSYANNCNEFLQYLPGVAFFFLEEQQEVHDSTVYWTTLLICLGELQKQCDFIEQVSNEKVKTYYLPTGRVSVILLNGKAQSLFTTCVHIDSNGEMGRLILSTPLCNFSVHVSKPSCINP